MHGALATSHLQCKSARVLMALELLQQEASHAPAHVLLKAIDILESRSGDKGWFLMSEAANIDKMLHQLDAPVSQ